ncbi:MAG: histidine kinase [Bryobacterales bacterium]|nr:histidine kinase [Bryobacteraceae bacterium]MDW8130293.1 histidine kinase [Bryobacterales bacterium]
MALEQYLIVLLLKLGVVTLLASFLARSGAFQRMLMREQRTMNQRLLLALSFASIFGTGAAIRIVTRGVYQAVDLGLEASLLAGLLGGYVTGLLAGSLISVPAMLRHEYLTLPLLAAAGALGGLLRSVAPDPEQIWRFSPFLDLRVYRYFRRNHEHAKAAFQMFFLLAILAAEFLRLSLDRFFPGWIFAIRPRWPNPHPLAEAAVYVTTVFAVTLPLKIWNNTRNERKLEEQQRLLIQARLDALSRQINPHFLFNTLNTVSSLIRTDPDQARAVVYKLSSILRRLLRKHDNFNPLSEELDFIDDYLSIEMIRFGDKLRFDRQVDPAALDRLVPSMILQPLVENCVRHGLSRKIEGGTIRLRAELRNGRLRLVVEDDGVGIPEARLATLLEEGIGVSNVNERLKVLFGSDYRMWIESKPGQGTRVEIEIPELQAGTAPGG